MLKETAYNRENTLNYARQWAMSRNPRFFDFEHLGGDCTNFASQCVYAGSGVMNHTAVTGWFYNNAGDRTASWTGVEFFYDFLTKNKSAGPYAVETDGSGIGPGDILQLGNKSGFYHSPVIVAVENGRIYVAAHTYDAYMRPLDSYVYERVRFLHIQGVRKSG